MSNDYYPIRLNTLRPDEQVAFDVYLYLGGRYLHYTRRSDEMEGERIKHLKSKGLRKLFILSQDEENYLGYLEKGLDVLADKNTDIGQKGAMAHDALTTAAENAVRSLETEAGFNAQKRQFEKVSDFLMSDRNALKSVLTSAGISIDNNHHAATVSSLAISVATKAQMSDQKDIFELGIASLLHDIGKDRLKFNSMRPRDQWTQDELRQYKNHPQDGADMLAGKPFISPRILGLIAAHEELGVGRGFPEKKDLFKLPLSYQILSLVNQFDHFATENGIQPLSAMDPFYEKFQKDFDEELINVLATVLT